jgi:hypothetical protein
MEDIALVAVGTMEEDAALLDITEVMVAEDSVMDGVVDREAGGVLIGSGHRSG